MCSVIEFELKITQVSFRSQSDQRPWLSLLYDSWFFWKTAENCVAHGAHCTAKLYILKPSQNTKGQKFFSCIIFDSFFTAGSWEKGSKNGADRKFFGLSYFVTALSAYVRMYTQSILIIRNGPIRNTGEIWAVLRN